MKHVLLTVVFLGIACVAMAHELLSPNGNLKLNVVLDSEGGPVYSFCRDGWSGTGDSPGAGRCGL